MGIDDPPIRRDAAFFPVRQRLRADAREDFGFGAAFVRAMIDLAQPVAHPIEAMAGGGGDRSGGLAGAEERTAEKVMDGASLLREPGAQTLGLGVAAFDQWEVGA